MPSFCKHIFVAGPKKGQRCEKFLRGADKELCYQHKKFRKDEKAIPQEATNPVEEKSATPAIKASAPMRIPSKIVEEHQPVAPTPVNTPAFEHEDKMHGTLEQLFTLLIVAVQHN